MIPADPNEIRPAPADRSSTLDADFQRIYNKSKNRVLNYITRSVRDRDEALDLLQEVFITFYDKLPELDISTDRIESWLVKTARNVILTYVRDTHRRLTRDLQNTQESDTWEKDEQVGKIYQKELEKHIDGFLESLNDNERNLFILQKIEQVKYSDLEKILGVPQRTMKRMAANLLQRLKERTSFDKDYLEN
ncbi:RNA polymerase sigma factor [Turneriella parva]|uniref:RNA polymerase, sigma-24 subunit, ECF subfamily n=1 Tax=Turneriella parva (strain ATCC BAA-1111 / DSM 21527 / NCTC 11395 / H) TaxID=869212 RepID=I4B6Z1_TURPD|nr:sigma-70 family RNA polymerase sigma factor [Turneriella parva]AFM13048.1 RNA polymerase, sigma-24 subunit, ECF subfamily [Turneriella parva DSM 21527]